MFFFGFFIIAQIFSLALAEVSVLRSTQYIYDKSPKLRIRGSGFDANDHDINLELKVAGQPALQVDKDYMITKDADGDGLILKLLGNRRWADLSSRVPPVALVLNSVKFSNNDANLLPEPVIVAQILNTPSVKENTDLILYKSASNELRINGTGFIGSKKVDFYFKPPLVKEVAYEDVTPYPLSKDQIVLRIRHGYNWRDDAGTLLVVGVDTGGGPVKVNGDEGLQVAEVKENLDEHNIVVDATAQEQLLYADEPNLLITGTGFSAVGNTLRFANGLAGNGVNYTVDQNSESSLSLRLVQGSFWRKNFENLPAPLTLLAVNAGQGFVAVGPTNTLKGKDIAMIFERPAIFSDHKKIFKTHTHSFVIKGTGFPTSNTKFRPALKFEPALKENVDYTIRVIDRTSIEITLADTKAWRSEPGPLYVVGLNTRGDDAGWIDYTKSKIYVAEVVEDTDSKETGGVQVIPYSTKVYQSTLKQSITVSGSGFSKDVSFEFDPPLNVDKDYTLSFQSENKVDLKLKSGKKWRAEPGSLIAKSVTVGGKKYQLAQGEGIRVAVVLADPVVTSSKDNYHETQSKLVVISGSGFTTKDETKISLNPTITSSYKVLGVLDDQIRLQLKPDKSWSSTFGSLKGEDDNKKYTLSVTSIDTGAGLISFDDPITIGYIVKDREGVTCDDSCELAFDGICDDGSEPNDEYYYQNYVYGDDDLGGYNYGEEDKEGEDGEGEETYYDDYDMPNEDYKVAGCVEGTDCTDCGGVDAIVDYSKPLDPSSGAVSCTNTCIYPRDGVCDDPRGTKMCALGTDCQDCGPVGADNFTTVDDDAVWDDDDDYWGFNDANFLDQTKGLEHNRHKVKKRQSVESAGPAAMFLVVLEGMVYTVGAIFAAAALYLLNRWYKGQSIPFMNVFNPDLNISAKEFEMRPHQRMPITPDEFRT